MLLFAAETWSLTVTNIWSLETAHQKCIRWILRIHWYDHVTNKEALQHTGQDILSRYLSWRRTVLFEHVVRLDESTAVHMAFQCNIDVLSFSRLPDGLWHRRPGCPCTVNGQINFRTSPTTHLDIYGGVLFAVVIMVEQCDVPHRLRDLWWCNV